MSLTETRKPALFVNGELILTRLIERDSVLFEKLSHAISNRVIEPLLCLLEGHSLRPHRIQPVGQLTLTPGVLGIEKLQIFLAVSVLTFQARSSVGQLADPSQLQLEEQSRLFGLGGDHGSLILSVRCLFGSRHGMFLQETT